MRELTKAERHECYKYAHKAISDGVESPFICDNLWEEVRGLEGFEGFNFDELAIHSLFPEFKNKQPDKIDDSGFGWFPKEEKEPRIIILTQCIAETAP